jgi:hypothetical protein
MPRAERIVAEKGSAAATVKIISTRIALDVLRNVGAFSSFVEIV